MSAQELAIWSTALGAIAAVALGRIADALLRPSRSQLQGVAYHLVVLLLVLILSGVATQVWPRLDRRLMHAVQVLAGPACIGLSHFWIRSWLSAAQRDRTMFSVLRAAAVLAPLSGIAALGLAPAQQLPAAALISLLGCTVVVWLAVRAWLLGDWLAPLMAAGCLLTVPAVAGLYAIAMGLPGISLPLHAALAGCAVLANGLTGFVLWRRDRHHRRTRAILGAVRLDPVTRLHNGTSLIQKLIKAQHRRRHSRRDGAVLAVVVFDVERLAAQAGTAGLNEMFIAVANRIQRQVGVVNPVGRYYDRCFVSLVESIRSPLGLRTLGLRVASSLRRPMEIMTASGHRMEIKVDVGVGVVHLARRRAAVEDILHDAQRMAEAARSMRSRAAMLDPGSGQVVAVERANLGPRRRGSLPWQLSEHSAPRQATPSTLA